MRYVDEPPRSTPVLTEVDVVVAGGGMSGVVAAVAAARARARTMIIERYSCLGGVATMGLPIQGYCSDDGTQIVRGIAEEFRERLVSRGGTVDHFIQCAMHNPFLIVQPEAVKTVCQEMLADAGVRVLLNTVVSDVVVEDGRTAGIIIEGKSGRQAVLGAGFVDCTGDADLVARSGGSFRLADPRSLQASTLNIILGNVDKKKLQRQLGSDPASYDLFPLLPREQITSSDYFIMAGLNGMIAEARKDRRFERLYGMSSFITLPEEGQVCINSVHVSGYSTCDTEGLSNLELEARAQVDSVVDFMRTYVAGFEDACILTTGPWLGIRESRIIAGNETLTLDDIQAGRRPPTTIALGGYPYDFHKKDVAGNDVDFAKVPVYGIPYGCLVPEGSVNLFVAGKTISATREAMSSSRVMAQCMAEGQAAGTAAAMCAATGTDAMELPIDELRARLLADGAVL